MITDRQFSDILKPVGYRYDWAHDNIYIDDEIIAVVDSVPGDVWHEDYIVVSVRVDNLDDERTHALRAMCVLHEIGVKEWKDNDHR